VTGSYKQQDYKIRYSLTPAYMLFRPTLYKTELQILRYEITGSRSKKDHKQPE
jgi:hypothetical protein